MTGAPDRRENAMYPEAYAKNPDPHKTDMIGAAMAMRALLASHFKDLGMLPLCRGCSEDCKQYLAVGLTYFGCKRGVWVHGKAWLIK